ncbi:tetratricopeptide repeat protein [Archangium gephyra]|uniref:TPR repeat protein n=1 Tax=Archangium gephyra TaxID=48 RepID=A0AAC8Q6P1_9BACT|nr:tetratricopeptide repeat protein [Archangium gephyra]AKJ01984.1 TPR repeat protein [Archangium gephyra]REG34791.1 tetratricopeptide repeat protein [Archangium gephyra]
MRNTILSACFAALSLSACDVSQLRRPQGLLPSTANRLDNRVLPSGEPTTEVVFSPPPALPSPGDALPETAGLPPPPRMPDEALSRAEELAPAEPADSISLPHEPHLYPVAHLDRARALREEGDLSGALTEARRAVHDAGDDVDAAEQALDVFIQLARLTGQKQLAADAYRELAVLFPDGPEPLVQQARLLLELGDTEGAFRAAEAALELDREYPEVYQVLGRIHLAAGQSTEAIIRFKQAVHLDPYHGYALNNLGLTYLRTGQDALAVEALAQAAYLLPQVGFVHNNLGLAYERLGRYEEARMAFDTATRLSTGDLKARLNLQRLNREARASVDLQALLGGRTSPGCPE